MENYSIYYIIIFIICLQVFFVLRSNKVKSFYKKVDFKEPSFESDLFFDDPRTFVYYFPVLLLDKYNEEDVDKMRKMSNIYSIIIYFLFIMILLTIFF